MYVEIGVMISPIPCDQRLPPDAQRRTQLQTIEQRAPHTGAKFSQPLHGNGARDASVAAHTQRRAHVEEIEDRHPGPESCGCSRGEAASQIGKIEGGKRGAALTAEGTQR